LTRRIRIGWNYDEEKMRPVPLYYPGDSHLILTAPSGSGKGRELLIPALIEYEGSTVVIDPKGQLCAVTGPGLAKRGKRVLVLNPFNILPRSIGSLASPGKQLPHVGFNPFAVLNPDADSFGADCDALAEAIVLHEGGGDTHWTDSARQLVSGVIMALFVLYPPEKRNLMTLYEIVTGPDFYKTARLAFDTEDLLICGRLGRFTAKGAEENKELTSIVSTAITQLNFMGNKAIANSLNPEPDGPVLRFADIRNEPSTVFLILPIRYLVTCSKWFRLVIAAAMADLLQEDRGPVPVLGLFDEFAQLGAMKVMSDIMGIGRGYGLRIWPVLQDLNQLKELYPQRWETFLSNAGAQIFFAPRDLVTAEWVSKRTGTMEIVKATKGVSRALWGTPEELEKVSANWGYAQDERTVLQPHQVAQLGDDQMLIWLEKIKGFVVGYRKPYDLNPEYRGMFDPDPYHAANDNSAATPQRVAKG
jgi:type IV secretion system protein VirD4